MLAPMALDAELDTARRLAIAAGAVALRWRSPGLAVEQKAGGEPVTEADREASELILAGLAAAFPDDLRVSEEAPVDVPRLAGAPRIWYVDPIDGTRDYIRGDAGFAVMIGLVVDGRPRLGVVYQPVGDRLFWAAPGSGAWLAGSDGSAARPLRCAPTTDPAAIRLVASKSHRSARIDQVKATLGIADELNIGSVGLKLGLIALGERDLYVNPSSNTKAWDTCAPEALIREAGGELTDLRGAPLAYRGPELRNTRGLLASNGLLHPAVLEKLRPLFPDL